MKRCPFIYLITALGLLGFPLIGKSQPIVNTSTPSWLSWPKRLPGGWRIASDLAASVNYDDNIFIAPNDSQADGNQAVGKRADLFFQLRPEIAIGRGDYRQYLNVGDLEKELDLTSVEKSKSHFFIGYDPAISVFLRTDNVDTFDQNCRLSARQSGTITELNEQFRFETETTPNSEIGDRVKRKNYSATLSGSYTPTDLITVSGGLHAYKETYSYGLGAKELGAAVAADYRLLAKFVLGGEAVVGQLRPDEGSRQSFYAPSVKLGYEATAKLQFSSSLGVDFRQFDTGVADRQHFIFNVSGRYDASETRSFTLGANRQIRASAQYSGENLLGTSYEASLRQRFYKHYGLTLVAGLTSSDYESNQVGSSLARSDEYYFGRVVVMRRIGRRSKMEAGYSYNDNRSSDSLYAYRRNVWSLSFSSLF